MMNFPLLTFIIFTPFIGVLTILLLHNKSNQSIIDPRKISLAFSIVNFIATIVLLFKFDKNLANFQFEEKLSCIERFNINYHLGIDGISLFFIILTSFLTIICLLASWNSITTRIKEYNIAFLVLSSLVIGVFCSLDFVVFYIFFEALLVPMFLIIGIWGGANRIYAAYKFFLYTFAGSVFLLIALIYIYNNTGTMNIKELMILVPKFNLEVQKYLWIAFFIGFAFKIPMWPFHTWLPDAHVQAPTAGSIMLAGILIKMGAYGFLRFSLPMLPDASYYFRDFIFILSSIAVIYTSLIALIQTDIKKLIAYSSVAHMGFVTAGIFSFNAQGIMGAIIQMISHGIVAGALFFSVGVIYNRMHTRDIAQYGGIVEKMPVYAFFMLLFTMASIGLPSTSGFVGEFMILVGIFKVNQTVSLLVATSMVLGAAYMLWLYKRMIFGKPNENTSNLSDLDFKEIIIYVSLAILVMLIGIYPNAFTKILDAPVNNIMNQININK